MKVLAIIPVREGSKRCPQKNVKPFAGKSLNILACEQAIRLKNSFDEIILSSNDPVAIDQCKQLGNDILIRNRPSRLCTSSASSESAIEDAISWSGGSYTHCLLLEVTSPFRKDEDIIESLRLAEETGRGVKSIVPVKNCIDGEVITDMYQLEGSIHLLRTDSIRDTPYDRFNLLIVPPERAWHIDYQWQFDCAEMLYNKNKC